jgi:hypothetical protein
MHGRLELIGLGLEGDSLLLLPESSKQICISDDRKIWRIFFKDFEDFLGLMDVDHNRKYSFLYTKVIKIGL